MAVTSMGALYEPGDSTTVHSDTIHSGDGSRRLAFVLHLSKDWRADWGGDMVFLRPLLTSRPSFNRMTLFAVGDTRHQHMVTPVAHITPKDAQRLAFVGWFYSRDDELASARSILLRQQQCELDEFVLTVSGDDGMCFAGPCD